MSNLDDQTQALLRQGPVKAPPGFRDSVMQDIAQYERERSIVSVSEQSAPRLPWWQWAVVTRKCDWRRAGGPVYFFYVVCYFGRLLRSNNYE